MNMHVCVRNWMSVYVGGKNKQVFESRCICMCVWETECMCVCMRVNVRVGKEIIMRVGIHEYACVF